MVTRELADRTLNRFIKNCETLCYYPVASRADILLCTVPPAHFSKLNYPSLILFCNKINNRTYIVTHVM